MTSLLSPLFTLLLFSEIYGTSAVPAAGNYDDSWAAQESLNALVEGDVGSKPAAGDGTGGPQNQQGFTLDNRLDDGVPRIIIVSDTGFRGHQTHGPDSAFFRSLPALTGPNRDQTGGDLRVKIERRQSDIDMLRCMIGRVYRPCWQA